MNEAWMVEKQERERELIMNSACAGFVAGVAWSVAVVAIAMRIF